MCIDAFIACIHIGEPSSPGKLIHANSYSLQLYELQARDVLKGDYLVHVYYLQEFTKRWAIGCVKFLPGSAWLLISKTGSPYPFSLHYVPGARARIRLAALQFYH